MAIANDGPQGSHRGKIGNMVYYILNGTIGRKTGPPSALQIRHWAAVKLVSTFLSKLKDFIGVGFSAEALGTTKNSFNVAFEENFGPIVTGQFPQLEIDFTKLVLSKGKLKPAQNPTVTEVAEGLRFSWDTNPQMAWAESTDQVMMLAYFPLLKKSSLCTFWQGKAFRQRCAGTYRRPGGAIRGNLYIVCLFGQKRTGQ